MNLASESEADAPIDALLIALPHALGLTPEARKAISAPTMKSGVHRLIHPIAVLHAQLALAKEPHPAATECDRLAAHPYDPLRVAAGVAFDKIADATAAIAACTKALEAAAGEPRFLLQRARAYAKAAEGAKEAGNEELAGQHTSARLADLAAAMERGYPMAFNNQGYAYANGNGVEKDEAKAADLYLETFNRVAHCCVPPVARHLLAVESQYDGNKIRQVVGALTDWSAALGNAEAHELLAEVALDGRSPVPADASPAAFAHEHFLIAANLHSAAGQGDAAAAVAARAQSVPNLTDADKTLAASRAMAFKAAQFTDLPPWMRIDASQATQNSK